MAQQQQLFFVVGGLEVGGAEKFTVALANSLDAEQFRITIVSLRHSNPLQQELHPHITFHAFGRRSKFDVKPLLQLRRLLKAARPEVLVSIGFFPFFMMVCATMLMKLPSRRLVSFHSMFARRKKEYWLTRLYRSFLRKEDIVIAVSEKQAQYTSKLYSIPLQQFRVIHNGVDTGMWTLPPANFDAQAIRTQYSLPANTPLIVKAAMFRHEKNHLGAIRALHRLHQDHGIKACLVLAGDGPMRAEIESEVSALGMQEYVRFIGMVKEMRPLYWISDLFVLCSQMENFSIAALEAMACGLPCVLTDIGGAAEMIVPGMNGQLSALEEGAMAQQWAHVLKDRFSAIQIHTFIHERFEQKNMMQQYAAMFANS